MRREGQVRGKPSSKSRNLGNRRCRKLKGRRCGLGNYQCRDFSPDHPGEKSWVKRKHRCKRFAANVCTNPALADFYFQPGWLTRLPVGVEDVQWCNSGLGTEEAEAERWSSMQLHTLDHATVNSMIEAAIGNMHGGSNGDGVNVAMACTTYEFGGGVPTDLGGYATDIDAIELAFQRVLGIFKNAVEGSSFSEYATQGWSTLSEESWSDVELSEPDEEVSPEDDWTVVDVDEDEAHE